MFVVRHSDYFRKTSITGSDSYDEGTKRLIESSMSAMVVGGGLIQNIRTKRLRTKQSAQSKH